jgi:hypothetical protein
MLSCTEVARILASDQLRDASWKRRFSLRIHLLMCRHCGRYAKQLGLIGTKARQPWTATDADESALKRIEQNLRKRP